MPYVLNEGFALEGFSDKPFCLVNEQMGTVRVLTASQMGFLAGCDGSACGTGLNAEQECMAQAFAAQGVISPVASDGGRARTRVVGHRMNDYPLRSAAQVAITGRCNLSCRHCLAASGEDGAVTQLSLDECRKIFADMREARIYALWITGGEPLVHPQFEEIVHAAGEYGLRIARLFTNALLVTDETLSLFEECGQRPEFAVSFDGLGTHDRMRRCVGAEERTLAAIRLIRSRGFDVCASINVNGMSAPRMVESCRSLVRDYGCTALHPIYTSPTPRWLRLAEDGERLEIGDYYDLMIELLRIAREERWPATLDIIHLPHLHDKPNARAAAFLRNPPVPRDGRRIMASCGRASSVVFIASDGRVLPCSTYEGETLAHGMMLGDDVNVKKRSLADILASSEYAEQFRMTIADLREAEEACRDCVWVQLCCGGCPLYTLMRHVYDCGNPICTLYKGGYAVKYLKMLEDTAATRG